MRVNQLLGIIFSNAQDDYLRELTDVRTMASVPLGGRYRLIDFALSSMVNSGIDKVGVITKSNYQSLLDHLGSGKAWDLSRKNEGLFILPPFGHGGGLYEGKVDALMCNERFLRNSKEEYVVLSDSDIVYNIDIRKVLVSHVENEADITVVYKHGVVPESMGEKIVFDFDASGRATSLKLDIETSGACNYGLRIYIMKKKFLLDAVKNAAAHNYLNFSRNIIADHIDTANIYGYRHDGYIAVMDSMAQYFEANMDLMKAGIRDEIFNERPIYTKVRDETPAVYGLGSVAKNSLIADGCVIDGEVYNSVLFRGVVVKKGARIQNCIIMQDSIIGEDTNLNFVIVDKNVEIQDDAVLKGNDTYPVYIRKGSVV